MTKKELEEKVAGLEERVRQLESRPIIITVPMQAPQYIPAPSYPLPWYSPYTVTC